MASLTEVKLLLRGRAGLHTMYTGHQRQPGSQSVAVLELVAKGTKGRRTGRRGGDRDQARLVGFLLKRYRAQGARPGWGAGGRGLSGSVPFLFSPNKWVGKLWATVSNPSQGLATHPLGLESSGQDPAWAAAPVQGRSSWAPCSCPPNSPQ